MKTEGRAMSEVIYIHSKTELFLLTSFLPINYLITCFVFKLMGTWKKAKKYVFTAK